MLTLADINNGVVQIVLFGGAAAVALTWIIAASASGVLKNRQREETRREIAAYVAEGTITAQDAALLLAEDESKIRQQIAESVTEGAITASDAERLLTAVGKSGPTQRPAVIAGVAIGRRKRDSETAGAAT